MSDEKRIEFGFGVKRDRYEVPVRGISEEDLAQRMRASIEAITRFWPPDTLITLFVSDFQEGGGLGYISNGERAGMIQTVREWLRRQETLT